MRSLTLVLASALLAAFTMVACQAGGPGANPPGETAETAQGSTVRRDNPCSLLSHEEVAQIVGAPITMREIVDEVTCHYIFDAPPASASPAAPGAATPSESQEAQAAEQMAKEFASAFSGGPPYLEVKIHWQDGRTSLLATKMAAQMFGSDSGFEKLTGIGDEAWLGPMASILVFAKGDVGIELDLRMLPNGRDRGIRIAKLIAGRL